MRFLYLSFKTILNNSAMARPKVTKLNPFTKDDKQYYLPNGRRNYKEPILNTNNDKCWFIYYSVWDYYTGKWCPVKDTSGDLNRKSVRQNKTSRKETAADILTQIAGMLEIGIDPRTSRAISPLSEKTLKQAMGNSKDSSPAPILRDAITEWKLLKSGIYDSKSLPENKENTSISYKSFFNKFLLYCEKEDVADTKLHIFPKIVVQEFFEKRFNIIPPQPHPDGRKKKSEKIGSGTWNTQLGWIKAMFSYYAKKYDYPDYVKNIADKKNAEDSEKYEPFTEKDVKRIFEYLDNPQVIDRIKYKSIAPADIFLGLVCRTIYYTFLRPSEIRRLKIKHVMNYKKGFFNLTTDITKTKKKLFNELYIQQPLVDEFEKLNWESYFKDKSYENYYVFTPDMVPSLIKSNRYSYSKKFLTVIKKLKIYTIDGRFSLYSFKPTGNIAAYKAGYDLFQISIQNRHTTTAQTETYLRKLKCDIASKPRPAIGKV